MVIISKKKEGGKTKMEKTKILLIWNTKKGKFDKFILNLALKQNVKDETHYIANQYIGEL